MIHSFIFFVVKAIRKAIRELLVKCPTANVKVACKLDTAPSNQTFKHNSRYMRRIFYNSILKYLKQRAVPNFPRAVGCCLLTFPKEQNIISMPFGLLS